MGRLAGPDLWHWAVRVRLMPSAPWRVSAIVERGSGDGASKRKSARIGFTPERALGNGAGDEGKGFISGEEPLAYQPKMGRYAGLYNYLFGTMSVGISVRAATEGDAEAIAPLVEELGYSADGETMRERLARLVARSDYLVAVAQFDSGEICGWIQAHSSEVLESGFRVEIVGLVTAKHMRRRGIGRLLVECAELWATRVGAQAIAVRSNVKRVESHGFYGALGYANTKTQNVYRKRIT